MKQSLPRRSAELGACAAVQATELQPAGKRIEPTRKYLRNVESLGTVSAIRI